MDLISIRRKYKNRRNIIIVLFLIVIIALSIVIIQNVQQNSLNEKIYLSYNKQCEQAKAKDEEILEQKRLEEEKRLREKLPNLTEQGKANLANIYKADTKKVYLTFDDGPSKTVTIPILDILKQENIKATFFVLGSRVELYPDIVKIEFDEYYRYKNKTDLVKLLTSIREGKTPDYSKLTNGKLFTISVDCNAQWREISNAKSQKMQCTLFCKSILYGVMNDISRLLKQNKSIAILCRNNIEVDKLVELFFEKGYYPKEFSDTKDMTIIGKHIKTLLQCVPISEKIANILSIVLLCTSNKVLFGENLSEISKLSYASFKKKTKSGYSNIKPLVAACAEKCDYETAMELVINIIELAEKVGETITFSKRKFIVQCKKLANPASETIDGIMLQRQYTNSFTNITPGLYITTIHQSKGKEFDNVFVLDVDKVSRDQNILYVSHSRMKEKLFPIVIKYNGLKYGNRKGD